VYFNLEAPGLSCQHGSAVPEASVFQQPAKRNDIFREWPSEVGRVASRMETAEVPVQFVLSQPDASLVSNNQRRIDGHHCAAVSRLRTNPVYNLVDILQSLDTPQV
jgi:hypothetical protein